MGHDGSTANEKQGAAGTSEIANGIFPHPFSLCSRSRLDVGQRVRKLKTKWRDQPFLEFLSPSLVRLAGLMKR